MTKPSPRMIWPVAGVAVAVIAGLLTIPQMIGPTTTQLQSIGAALPPEVVLSSPVPIPPDPTPVPQPPQPPMPPVRAGGGGNSGAPSVGGEGVPPAPIGKPTDVVRGSDSRGNSVIGGGGGPAPASQAPVLPPEPPAGGPCSVMPNWAITKGAEIIAQKRAAGDHKRDFAYRSDPIDITGSGVYVMDFGPLDPGRYENYPPPLSRSTPPEPVSVLLPDDVGPINYGPTSPPPPTTIIKHGARYLRVAVSMDNNNGHTVRSCKGLIGYLV